MERVSTDEKTRIFTSRMLPDPRRYEPVGREGAPLYRDKYLDEVLSLQDMAEAFQAPSRAASTKAAHARTSLSADAAHTHR